MKFESFLLDKWIDEHAESGIEFNMAASTGPRWKLRELLDLAGPDSLERLLGMGVAYSRSAGDTALREAIAGMEGVPAEEVVVFAGGAEALFHIFYLASGTGANVILPFPCFPAFEAVPQSLGIEVRSYHLRPENSYRIDFDEVKRLADANTKLLVVNSPHNPSGATLSDVEMSSLHDFAAARGIQFVSDQVYHPIYHGRESSSAAALPHATVVGDFSKAFSMGGLRLGWVVERDARRREEYLNAREYVSVSNSPMTEYLGLLAIQHREKVLGRTLDVTRANLGHLDRLMAEFSDVLEWVRPQGGTVGFPRILSGADGCSFAKAAVPHGLLFAPGDCFGVRDHFRVGFGVGIEWYPRAMERFADFLHAWAHAPRASVSA
ncbi:MAG TPA: pyridoxal phosphate-dependent aminotransferase [Candidatus Sulfotelmatobacter sp.]|nr:pyridoxal phosphate-dependent aminotransferase [Candidatus Sulfotelmatobacter sp.]